MGLNVTLMFHGFDPQRVEEGFRRAFEAYPYNISAFLRTVEIEILDWEKGWGRLVEYAAHKYGPDISEIGTTWLSTLVAMEAVRPLERHETNALLSEGTFVEGLWKMVRMGDSPEVWAVPFFADVRVVYCWWDMLEAAGVDPEEAFTTPEQVEAAFEALQAHGVTSPFAIPLGSQARFLYLQFALSWVRGAGGDLLSPDFKRVTLLDPPALRGLKAFYRLARFMPLGGNQLLTDVEINTALFPQRRIAATMGGTWILGSLEDVGIDLSRLAILLPPGPPFLGGSVLVVWRHSHNLREVLRFLRLATHPQVQVALAQFAGLLPVRLESLDSPPFSTDPYLQRMTEAVRRGEGFPLVPLWGIIEDRITTALHLIWQDMVANPSADPEPFILKHLEPVVGKLNGMLQER